MLAPKCVSVCVCAFLVDAVSLYSYSFICEGANPQSVQFGAQDRSASRAHTLLPPPIVFMRAHTQTPSTLCISVQIWQFCSNSAIAHQIANKQMNGRRNEWKKNNLSLCYE